MLSEILKINFLTAWSSLCCISCYGCCAVPSWGTHISLAGRGFCSYFWRCQTPVEIPYKCWHSRQCEIHFNIIIVLINNFSFKKNNSAIILIILMAVGFHSYV